MAAPINFSGGDDKFLYVPERDYVGYGKDTPSNPWPNNAKIAVSFVLNYEEGGESSLWNGDERSIGSLHELKTDRPVLEGRRDYLVESMYEYGIRGGLPRIMKLFDQFGYKFTLWMVGRAAETSGFYPKLLADKGHEVSDHGSRWSTPGKTYDEAKWQVHTTIDRLQKATGRSDVPYAYFMANSTADSPLARAEVHKERGVPLVYHSDTYADDLPYYIQDPLVTKGEKDEGMLCIPYSLYNNDVAFLANAAHGVSKADEFFDALKADFDYLYKEGVNGKPKMMTIAMHSRVLGKPGRSMAIRRFMEYIKDKPEVWVCTRKEIADHWRKEFPYEKVGMTAATHVDVMKY